MIDLRSDTVTIPKQEMLNAILSAKLGDDILEEDPTVNELEEKIANLLGMEDALLVTSGTMANQIAIMTFCQRGEEIIMGEDSHVYLLEGAATSIVAQVQIKPVPVNNGIYDIETLKQYINVGDIQQPRTSLICLENTYNLNKGLIIPLDHLKEIRKIADEHRIPIYMDGARLFNATVELNVDPKEVCQYIDAVQICLTKGLGCPIGSILAGSKTFIEQAILNRQRLGGGMRQAGIIAAPALYALDHMIDRLIDDNKRAKYLAEKLSTLKGLSIDLAEVQTNIVSPILKNEDWDSEKLIDFLLDNGIKVKKIGEKQVRMIVHYLISDEDIEKVIKAFETFTTTY